MSSLKIGFVLDDTLDTPDGVQQYILTLGTWLSAQGHEVHYLVGQTERTDIPHVHSLGKNVRVKFNGNRMSTPLPASKRAIRRVLAQEKFDVLHVQIPYSPFLAQRVILAAPASTVVVGTFHIAPQSGAVSLANRLLGYMLRPSLKRFDAIFSVSQAAADFAGSAFGIKTTVLPNVVNAGMFAKAAPMPLAAEVPTIMFLGRLVPRKGCQVLLRALTILRSKNPEFKFQAIICGKGPLRESLEAYTAGHRLNDSVRFSGFIDDATKARYLKSADIAVFPSTGGESFGIVLLEAMAAGHPVVLGADNPGYATVLRPSPNSLFPVNDPAALADKLAGLLRNQTTADSIRNWQQQYVLQFDVAVVGRRLLARYRELLRQKHIMR